jgi:hypothetical protein
MNIESLFLFLDNNPAVRWGILAALLLGAGLLAILPPNRKKLCHRCSPEENLEEDIEEALQTSQSLREASAQAKNPNLYQKNISFNKKDIEFDITFPHPESWKRDALENFGQEPTFLEDPLYHNPPEETSWAPSEENRDMPSQYCLHLRCKVPLSGTERQAIHNYLATEGYIEDAHKFYKALKKR